jgi:hypothetical protein
LKELGHASDDVAGARGQIDQAGLRRALLFVGHSTRHQGQGQPRLLFVLVHGEFSVAVPDLHFKRVMLENSKRLRLESAHPSVTSLRKINAGYTRGIGLLLQFHVSMPQNIDITSKCTLNILLYKHKWKCNGIFLSDSTNNFCK